MQESTTTVKNNPVLHIKPAMEAIWKHHVEQKQVQPYLVKEQLPYIPPLGYATPGSVGIDIPLQYDIELSAHVPMFIDLGFQCAVPEGYMLALVARSGTGVKRGVTPRNKIGIIDQDYRHNLGLIVTMDTYGELVLKIATTFSDVEISNGTGILSASPDIKQYRRGECIAQAILIPITQAEIKLTDTLPTPEEGRVGGFGSSNR